MKKRVFFNVAYDKKYV